MTKTISINLGGLLFHIDDLAFQQLQAYFEAIERQFPNETERKEIMQDIESRVAELFTERINREKDVVSASVVEAVIGIMGEPLDFATSDEHSDSEQNNENSKRVIHKRMYRDPDERVLGGVCAGLAAYFNTESWIFRILFFVFTFFFLSGFLIYLILWIIIPEANTTAKKLEMRGEPITIENIKNTVINEFERVKQRIKW
ncbi:MAG: PspC domain-containing protein [Salinivirgaceae bacterium]|jgi:phage shock protein PspC (stress-responsive transcriptional regulator)